MVGGGSYIGNFKTSNIAALVIILVELAMGLYLMESLRITHLFPIIGQMDDKMRIRMIWTTFLILLILAGIESALASMRDRIAADMQTLRQALSAVETAQPTIRWIPMVGQMVMGFILPFALAFVAIPLESFIHSSRTVAGVVMAAFLRMVAFSLRLGGNAAHYSGEYFVGIYELSVEVDRLIAGPLVGAFLKAVQKRVAGLVIMQLGVHNKSQCRAHKSKFYGRSSFEWADTKSCKKWRSTSEIFTKQMPIPNAISCSSTA